MEIWRCLFPFLNPKLNKSKIPLPLPHPQLKSSSHGPWWRHIISESSYRCWPGAADRLEQKLWSLQPVTRWSRRRAPSLPLRGAVPAFMARWLLGDVVLPPSLRKRPCTALPTSVSPRLLCQSRCLVTVVSPSPLLCSCLSVSLHVMVCFWWCVILLFVELCIY